MTDLEFGRLLGPVLIACGLLALVCWVSRYLGEDE